MEWNELNEWIIGWEWMIDCAFTGPVVRLIASIFCRRGWWILTLIIVSPACLFSLGYMLFSLKWGVFLNAEDVERFSINWSYCFCLRGILECWSKSLLNSHRLRRGIQCWSILQRINTARISRCIKRPWTYPRQFKMSFEFRFTRCGWWPFGIGKDFRKESDRDNEKRNRSGIQHQSRARRLTSHWYLSRLVWAKITSAGSQLP